MFKYENECCDCQAPGYPCLGVLCPRLKVPHYYCDSCGEETQLYELDEFELCIDCVEKRLVKVNKDV